MASQAKLVENDAFSRLMEIHPEKQPYEMGGYLYLTVKESSGWVTYRTYGPKFMRLYVARRTVTQNNAGGGVLSIRISIDTPNIARVIGAWCAGPVAVVALSIQNLDEDGAQGPILQSIAAGASRTAGLPGLGQANASGGSSPSVEWILPPGGYLQFLSGTAANTETLTVYIELLLPITATEDDVNWDTTGSTGTPSALSASSISAANGWQVVLLP